MIPKYLVGSQYHWGLVLALWIDDRICANRRGRRTSTVWNSAVGAATISTFGGGVVLRGRPPLDRGGAAARDGHES